jgi:DNA recombination protein Rad52
MFTDEQKAHLAADLDRSHVKERTQSGRKLPYVEGWHAIAEANRIFGFDAWDRETVEIKCVAENPRKIGQDKRDGFGVSYIAKVRVTVDGRVREGVGAGHGIDADLGLAHESAIKEAETDAMKRALMTFGNPFGLALYDKTQEHVASAPKAALVPRSNVKQSADDANPFDDDPKPAAPFADEYVREAKIVIREWKSNAIKLKEWWDDEAPYRQQAGVIKGTAQYAELFEDFCHMGKSIAGMIKPGKAA